MNLIKWGEPQAFYLFGILILWIGLAFYTEKKQRKTLNQYFGPRVTPWLLGQVSYSKKRIKLFLQILSAGLCILALARPQVGQSEQEVKSEGVELMILSDVSDSMLAEDIKPSRLELMKIELSKLMEIMPGNKTGLIAFAGSAALMSPLTSDPSALKMYIQSLDTYSISHQGTSLETALMYAQEAFEKGGVTQTQELKSTRVILVASDGEDHEEGAIEAAKKLAEKGIHIITVAYGTEEGATIPQRDPYGNLMGPKKNKNGEVIKTQVKGDFLKKIAEAGGGHFYNSSFNGDHLKLIAQDINLYEKAQFDQTLVLQYDEKYMYPLSLGFLIWVISLFVGDRRTGSQIWKGRYETSPLS